MSSDKPKKSDGTQTADLRKATLHQVTIVAPVQTVTAPAWNSAPEQDPTEYFVPESGVFIYSDKDFSVGGRAAISVINSRLNKLMGSEVIRILDREWVNTLGVKIQQNYEEELRQQERRLHEAELNRTTRLSYLDVIEEAAIASDGRIGSGKTSNNERGDF